MIHPGEREREREKKKKNERDGERATVNGEMRERGRGTLSQPGVQSMEKEKN